MKKFVLILMVVALVMPAMAAPSWMRLDFDSLVGGVVSYDATGGNVVVKGVDGTAFGNYAKATSMQIIAEDAIENPISGNFAMYGVFNYTDTDNVLGWAVANPNTKFGLEIRAREVQFDVDFNGTYGGDDFTDNLVLDAADIPGLYMLTTTLAELVAPGNADLTNGAGGIWMDIAIDPVAFPGQIALSIVIDGMVFHGDPTPSFDANLLPGELGGYVPGNYVGSCIRITPVPVPGAVLLGGLGVGLVGWMRRKKTL